MTPLKTSYVRVLQETLIEHCHSPIPELSVRLERRRRSMSEDATGTSEYDPTTYAKIIEEKERDLELVSKVGLDLLKQNQELKERNDFLQSSLRETNEVITQLQHDLKTRNSLLQTFEDYEDDCYAISDSGDRIGIVEKLKEQVNQLETETVQLRNESAKLRQKTVDTEEFSHERIEDYLKQLEQANLRISKLQAHISEKNHECTQQTQEIRRLLEELTSTRSREKSLGRTNEELTQELNEAVSKHEDLKLEIIQFQDLYVEVKSSLVEAEEELRGYRINSKPHRTHSMDSLYDSLSSELEASDSGFYTTPMISARTDSRQSTFNDSCFMNLQEEIERLRRLEEPIIEASNSEIMSTVENSISVQSSAPQYVEVPSKVLMNAYRRSMSADRHHRLLKETSLRTLPLALETESNPGPSTSSNIQREKALFRSHAVCTEFESIDHPENNNSTQFFQRNGKMYRNTCCSPIRVPSPPPKMDRLAVMDKTPQSSPRSINSKIECSNSSITSYAPHSSASSCCRSPASSSTDGALSKSTSADSLVNYEERKLGEPGKPGTKDLEYSLRKMNFMRQKLAEEYEQYRKRRGLPISIGLFDPKFIKITNFSVDALSPFSRYFQKVAAFEKQQLWRKLPYERNLGLNDGMQISPIARGVFHRSFKTSNNMKPQVTIASATVPSTEASISTQALPRQSYSDCSLFDLNALVQSRTGIRWPTMKPFQKTVEESTPTDLMGIERMSGLCAAAQNHSTIVQRGAL